MRLKCPHCIENGRNGISTIRSSKQLSATVREATVQCNDPECAHTWVTTIVADRTIAPSCKPSSKVFIRLSPRSPAANAPAGNQLELGMDHPPPRFATG